MNTIDDMIRDYVLEAVKSIEWEDVPVEIIKIINGTHEPEEVFDEETLSNWAERNGYRKGET